MEHYGQSHNWNLGEHHNFKLYKVISLPDPNNYNQIVPQGNGLWWNRQGTWINLADNYGVPLPENTLFVSGSFNNVFPYFVDLEQACEYLNNNPPTAPITILCYEGLSYNAVSINYDCTLIALGKHSVINSITVNTANFSMHGPFRLEDTTASIEMSYASAMTCIVNVEYIEVLKGNIPSLSRIEVQAVRIGKIDLTGSGLTTIRCTDNRIMTLNGYVNVFAHILTTNRIETQGEITLHLFQTKVFNSTDCVQLENADQVKFENCLILSENGFGIIVIGAIPKVIFINTNISSISSDAVNVQGNMTYFVRGECYLSNQMQGTFTRMNTNTDFIIDSAATFENF